MVKAETAALAVKVAMVARAATALSDTVQVKPPHHTVNLATAETAATVELEAAAQAAAAAQASVLPSSTCLKPKSMCRTQSLPVVHQDNLDPAAKALTHKRTAPTAAKA